MPRRGKLGSPTATGLLVASTTSLEGRLREIEERRISWLRTDLALSIQPNHLPDERIGPAIDELPAKPWPRDFVPFSHDTTLPGGLELVVGKIGPLIVAAAAAGREFVEAEWLAQTTHRAVWNVTDTKRHAGWIGAVDRALEALATGKLADVVTYQKALRRIHVLDVHNGERPSEYRLRRLRALIAGRHQRVLRNRRRVPRTPESELQTTLFGEDEL